MKTIYLSKKTGDAYLKLGIVRNCSTNKSVMIRHRKLNSPTEYVITEDDFNEGFERLDSLTEDLSINWDYYSIYLKLCQPLDIVDDIIYQLKKIPTSSVPVFHMKSGNHYQVTDLVVNCTNGDCDGDLMVVYVNQRNNLNAARHIAEFVIKFKFMKVNIPNLVTNINNHTVTTVSKSDMDSDMKVILNYWRYNDPTNKSYLEFVSLDYDLEMELVNVAKCYLANLIGAPVLITSTKDYYQISKIQSND